MTVYTTTDSPLGELLLVGEEPATGDGGVLLASVSAPGQKGRPVPRAGWRRDPRALREAVGQLAAYFAGESRHFDLACATHGSEFQEKVWRELDAIPYGTTTTYGAIARRIGAPRSAVRSVGAAIGANPLLLVRPCHRVIGADGSLTGYAAGLDRKELLLTHEGALQPRLG